MINILFTLTLILGTLITISATTWIPAWVGLELNLISFIPLMLNNPKNTSSEAALKYFLIQTFASIFLLASIIMMASFNFTFLNNNFTMAIMIISLGLKMGASPLHFWLPGIMQMISWANCLLIMTWQKLAPLIMMLNLKSPLIMTLAITSALVGSIGGYNQMLTRKILAYSSINHLGWLMTSTMISDNMLMMYFTMYVIINVIIILMMMNINMNHITQTPTNTRSLNMSLMLSINLLSLGGIPPFLGFIPKWLVINSIINEMPLQTFALTMSSLISLYFYLRICYMMMLKSYSHLPTMKSVKSPTLYILTMVSALGPLTIIPILLTLKLSQTSSLQSWK